MKILCLDFYHFLKAKTPILFLLLPIFLHAQEGFYLPLGKVHDKIDFKLVNNLIILPVELNGVQLSFVLDTGVGSTILFSLDNRESLELNNASKINLKGLGNEAPVEAIKSKGNFLKIGNASSENHTVFMIFDESMNFSPSMGVPIHGIIGYEFFNKFVVDINYTKESIKISDPRSYIYTRCKKCYQTDLDLNNGRKRPLVKTRYKTKDGIIDTYLLLDSGSGSALWLFENKRKGITVPENAFDDFLGKGFNGDVYGKKTKVDGLLIGDFEMNKITASFPDSLYIRGVSKTKRHGSLGGRLLKRFDVIIDYQNKKITFKKNNFFSKPFFYNMSGLTIEHNGARLSKEYNIRKDISRPSLEFIRERNGKISVDVFKADASSFIYSLEPEFIIAHVRPNSPAALAGLLQGDKILTVNNKRSNLYKLSDLNDLFYSEEGKKITMKIERLGVIMTFKFYLKRIL